MKWLVSILLVLISASTMAQRDLTPNSRKSAFGKRDLRNLANYGFQFQLGATYLMTKPRNTEYEIRTEAGELRATYLHDEFGRLGAFAEIGMFHFPKKRSKLSLALKTVLVSYYDWGIGYKHFRGGEDSYYNVVDPISLNKTALPTQRFTFLNGHIYGRFSVHKNIHFKNKKKRKDRTDFFLDNSLGINVDYRLVQGYDRPNDGDYNASYQPDQQQYSGPLFAQIHYGLGFGFRLKRGAYLIPGVRAPLVGYQQVQGAPSTAMGGKDVFTYPMIHWFSSRYWPILFHVKYMFLLEKKNKNGCPPAEINDRDRNTQQNR